MINTPKQRQYYQREKRIFTSICLMLGILVTFSIVFLYVWTNYRKDLSTNGISFLFASIILFFLLAAIIFTSWEQNYRKLIYENESLDPNVFDLHDIGFKSFINDLKQNKSVFTDEKTGFYMLHSIEDGTPFKIFFSRVNTLTVDEVSKMNLKCIERENHMDMDLSQDKSIRINVLFVDDFNFNASNLVSHNATHTLSSKIYTSIVVDLDNEKLYIPAHLGLNGMRIHKKLMNLLGTLFFNNLK